MFRTHKLIKHLGDRKWHVAFKLNGPRFGSQADRRCYEFVKKGWAERRINDKGFVEFRITLKGLKHLKSLA